MTDSPALQALLHNWFYGNYAIRELAAVVFAALFASIPITPAFAWVFGDLDPRIARTAAALAPVANAIKKASSPWESRRTAAVIVIGLLAAVAAVAGHCYCPWRRFSGGTGVALLLGVLAAICWPAAIIYLAVWLVAAVASNYALVGSLLASAMSIFSLWYFLGAPSAFCGRPDVRDDCRSSPRCVGPPRRGPRTDAAPRAESVDPGILRCASAVNRHHGPSTGLTPRGRGFRSIPCRARRPRRASAIPATSA